MPLWGGYAYLVPAQTAHSSIHSAMKSIGDALHSIALPPPQVPAWQHGAACFRIPRQPPPSPCLHPPLRSQVLARLNLEGCRLPPGKEAAIRACLLAKQKWHKKKKALCVHIGWAFFARLFDYRRFEHGRWTSGGHWRTNGYTVAVTLQRPRDPPRPGDPPPPPPKEAKAGKRNNAGASKGALHHQSREIANEHYRCVARVGTGPCVCALRFGGGPPPPPHTHSHPRKKRVGGILCHRQSAVPVSRRWSWCGEPGLPSCLRHTLVYLCKVCPLDTPTLPSNHGPPCPTPSPLSPQTWTTPHGSRDPHGRRHGPWAGGHVYCR